MTCGTGAGRFAPSPTGPLHLGSLLAAVASYLDARATGLAWRLRFDDLDAPRNQPGAERAILEALEAHGLTWDGPIHRQSRHQASYQAALDALGAQGRLFYCRCTRRTLAAHRLYPGTCRHRTRPQKGCAVRVRVDAGAIRFDDLFLGPQNADPAETFGDFVVQRRDGIIAYQLATAVDDGAADIVRVIRGRDLLGNTAPQIWLMRCLGLAVPVYGHLPLLLNAGGQKLSKQSYAAALDNGRAAENLARVLRALSIDVPAEAAAGGCEEVLGEAIRRWPPPSGALADTVLAS
jgi:glutamyl-Q tRNA(Asp) synthetase